MGKELVHVYRGDSVESIHCGSVAVVDVKGTLRRSAGDAYFTTFMRSSAKPIQAMPVVFSGAAEKYGFTDRELSVMCASHNGETVHVETVRSVLQKIGVPEEKLSCGVHAPYHKPTADEMLRSGIQPQPIHCNCSGKHSAMLTLCTYYGWDLDAYIQLEHPVQQMMLDVMSDLTDVPRRDFRLGVDGCGVPVFGLPLYNMALSYARLSQPETLPVQYQESARVLTRAMYTEPMLVAGTGRFCTDLMRVMRGKVFAKVGAEAVYCVGFVGLGLGLAVKVDDGGSRGKELVVLKAMEDLGLISAEEIAQLGQYRHPEVKNHRNEVIGHQKAVFTLE